MYEGGTWWGNRARGGVEEPNSESYRLTRRKKTIVRTSCKPREKGQIRMAVTREPTLPHQPTNQILPLPPTWQIPSLARHRSAMHTNGPKLY